VPLRRGHFAHTRTRSTAGDDDRAAGQQGCAGGARAAHAYVVAPVEYTDSNASTGALMTTDSPSICRSARLGELLSGLDITPESCSALIEASERADSAVEKARVDLRDSATVQKGDDVIAFGSMARGELTTQSDLDWLVVTSNRDVESVGLHSIDVLRETIVDGVVLAEPGSSGMFGTVVCADDLTTNIGLQADTNLTLSRRILFLEESVSLANPAVHEGVLSRILESYLAVNPRSDQLPRFLLNDIIRYWRTVAVDYQAKAQAGAPAALRYLKLLIPRKLCYVAAIAPLYEAHATGVSGGDRLQFLLESYQEPASHRLIKFLGAAAPAGADEALRAARIVGTLNEFVSLSGDQEWRAAIEHDASGSDPKQSQNYGRMRDAGKQLHDDLGFLFTSKHVIDFSREFMII